MYQRDPLESRLATACRVDHTVIPQTVARFEFWFALVLQFALYYLNRSGRLNRVPGFENNTREQTFDWKEVHVACTLTVFFEVFYINACYKRYVTYYRQTRALFVQVMLVVYDLRLHLKYESAAYARLVHRYVLCSMLFFWERVNEERNISSLGEAIQDYKSQLLSEEEDVFLSGIDPEFRYLVTMRWSMEVLRDAAKVTNLQPSSAILAHKKLQVGLELMGELNDQLTLPIPFPYFHLLNVMVCVSLILLVICLGFANSHLSCIVFLVADLVFLGLLELSSALADPFGDDDIDFPVSNWLRSSIERAEILLEYCSPLGVDNYTWDKILEHHCNPVLMDADLGAFVYGTTSPKNVQQTQHLLSPGLKDLEISRRHIAKVISTKVELRDEDLGTTTTSMVQESSQRLHLGLAEMETSDTEVLSKEAALRDGREDGHDDDDDVD